MIEAVIVEAGPFHARAFLEFIRDRNPEIPDDDTLLAKRDFPPREYVTTRRHVLGADLRIEWYEKHGERLFPKPHTVSLGFRGENVGESGQAAQSPRRDDLRRPAVGAGGVPIPRALDVTT